MNDDTPVYGSAQLTPAVIRNTRFPGSGAQQGYSPAAVHEFLEQVASAVEVLGSADAAAAIRRELERSSEISARMVLVGHETAERLRQQAATDAQAIIEDAKRLTEQLRDAARNETERTRQHVESLRGSFIDELRDMYDRIGATLYRFETASRGGAPAGVEPGSETPAAAAPAGAYTPPPLTYDAADELADQLAHDAYDGHAQSDTPIADELAWSTPEAPATPDAGDDIAVGSSWLEDNTTTFDVPPTDATAPQAPEQLAPAWTQIPDELQQTHSVADLAAAAPGWTAEDDDDDAPLAPGEPLVDLRALHEGAAVDAPAGGDAVGEAGVDATDGQSLGAAVDEHADGGWLDAGGSDDDRAEAMIAGLDEVLAGPSAPTETPEALTETLAAEVPEPATEPEAVSTEYAEQPVAETPAADAAAAVEPVAEPDTPAAAVEQVPDALPEAPVADEAAASQPPFGGVETFAEPQPAYAPEAQAGYTPGPPASESSFLVDAVAGAAPEAAPAAVPATGPAAAPDPAAVRQFVLQSLHDGQPRDQIEAYLRESLGVADPTGFVNEALNQA